MKKLLIASIIAMSSITTFAQTTESQQKEEISIVLDIIEPIHKIKHPIFDRSIDSNRTWKVDSVPTQDDIFLNETGCYQINFYLCSQNNQK